MILVITINTIIMSTLIIIVIVIIISIIFVINDSNYIYNFAEP